MPPWTPSPFSPWSRPSPAPRLEGRHLALILREYPESLFRSGRPVMVQALHFKDYPGVTGKHLARWRSKPLRAHYNGALGLDYRAPIFVDSGGYLFLGGEPPVLKAFGLTDPLEVFRLVLDLVDAPGDRVTPLDYPIPPAFPRRRRKDAFPAPWKTPLRPSASWPTIPREKGCAWSSRSTAGPPRRRQPLPGKP